MKLIITRTNNRGGHGKLHVSRLSDLKPICGNKAKQQIDHDFTIDFSKWPRACLECNWVLTGEDRSNLIADRNAANP